MPAGADSRAFFRRAGCIRKKTRYINVVILLRAEGIALHRRAGVVTSPSVQAAGAPRAAQDRPGRGGRPKGRPPASGLDCNPAVSRNAAGRAAAGRGFFASRDPGAGRPSRRCRKGSPSKQRGPARHSDGFADGGLTQTGGSPNGPVRGFDPPAKSGVVPRPQASPGRGGKAEADPVIRTAGGRAAFTGVVLTGVPWFFFLFGHGTGHAAGPGRVFHPACRPARPSEHYIRRRWSFRPDEDNCDSAHGRRAGIDRPARKRGAGHTGLPLTSGLPRPDSRPGRRLPETVVVIISHGTCDSESRRPGRKTTFFHCGVEERSSSLAP